MVTTLLVRNTQIVHSGLAEHITPYSAALRSLALSGAGSSARLASLDRVVSAQAAMVAYLDDFKLMMLVTICVVPLVFLMRRPRQGGGAAVAVE